jgi:hypothetical protein
MDSDPPATPMMVLEESTDSNILSPTQRQQQLRLENVVSLLHQSLNPLLKEMDASQTFVVGCKEWIHNANRQVTHLDTLTRLFQSQSSLPPTSTATIITNRAADYASNETNPFILMMMLNMWKSQIATVLRAVFYNTTGTTTITPPSLQGGGEPMLLDVTQSKIRTIHRSAAICLRTLVHAITTHPPTSITQSPSMPSAGRFPHVKPCIMALLRGLATPTDTSMATNVSDSRTSAKTASSSSSSWSKSSLEDPTVTWIEIMITLRQLLQVYQEEEERTTLPTTHDLVLRLVGEVTTTMTWMMMNRNRSHTNSSRATTTTTTSHAGTVQLQIESVAVLSMCMDKVNDAGLWQAMFPGTLATIYQCLVSCHRQTSTGRLVQLECSCLGFIQQMLLITLQPIQEERFRGASRDNSHLVSKAAVMLQNLAHVASSPSRKGIDQRSEESATSTIGVSASSALTSEPPPPSSDFLCNVHDKAVPHLIILFKQSSTLRSSPKVMIQAIQLARTILIDTNLCWKECRHNVVESALECCLILQHQTLVDGTIVYMSV